IADARHRVTRSAAGLGRSRPGAAGRVGGGESGFGDAAPPSTPGAFVASTSSWRWSARARQGWDAYLAGLLGLRLGTGRPTAIQRIQQVIGDTTDKVPTRMAHTAGRRPPAPGRPGRGP